MRPAYLKLAILPFSNISATNENEYICDGITEEIINALSQIKGLNVISRTSTYHYKNANKTLQEIGNELSTDLIIEGSVRIFKNKLRVNATLLKIADSYALWNKSWDGQLKDIFDLQDAISVDIAETVREDFGHLEINEQLVTSHTNNIDAYKLYLKGKFLYFKWNSADVRKAISNFEESIRLDPNYTLSYSSLSQCYTFLAGSGFIDSETNLKKAKQLSEKAISINKNIPEVYFGMSNVTFWKEWDFNSTFKYLNKTLDLNPSYAPAYSVLAVTYLLGGQITKAYENIAIARRLDPHSNNSKFLNSLILYFDKRYKEAIKVAKDILYTDERMLTAYDIYASSLIMLGKYKEIIELLNSEHGSKVEECTKNGYFSIAYYFLNDVKKHNYYFERLSVESNSFNENRNLMYRFFYYCIINNKKEAISLLRKSVKMKASFLLFGFSDPFTQNIQNEPDYIKLKVEAFGITKPTINQKKESNPSKPLVDKLVAEKWKERIIKVVEVNELYLNPEITLRSFAKDLNLHPNQLSYILNTYFNKSFTNFINSYRIQYFLGLLERGQNTKETFMALAYDSGFNSKTAFYNFFKKHTGKTPKQYLSK